MRGEEQQPCSVMHWLGLHKEACPVNYMLADKYTAVRFQA
jgi:hypothetical protein